jgi:hypothetical protein
MCSLKVYHAGRTGLNAPCGLEIRMKKRNGKERKRIIVKAEDED